MQVPAVGEVRGMTSSALKTVAVHVAQRWRQQRWRLPKKSAGGCDCEGGFSTADLLQELLPGMRRRRRLAGAVVRPCATL